MRHMPVVEFLTDDEASAYGRYGEVPSRADLERVFFLDDEDRELVEHRRGDHMKLGFSLQLVTVRWVGAFLEDPLEVPTTVLDFVAEQLGIADPSCVKKYTERTKTRFDHQWEIRRVRPEGVRDRRSGSASVGGGQVLDHGGWTEGDLSRRGELAAGGGCAPARGDDAGPAGYQRPR